MRSSPASSLSFLSVSLLGVLLCQAGCATAAPAPAAAPDQPAQARQTAPETSQKTQTPPPFPSTYKPLPSPGPVLITNATILDGTGRRIEGGAVLLRDGKIAAVGQSLEAPAGATVVDGTGKWVTPGFIDAHSHLGVYSSPEIQARDDGNEDTDPNTAEVWAEHSIWPQDPQFPLALAGGVTTQQILPGSANLIGGRSVIIKTVLGRGETDMKFPGAPQGLKMACGENPKRVYGSRNRTPATRMGSAAGYRAAWIKAEKYRRDWDEYNRKKEAGQDAKAPDRDLELETLAAALRGDILVQTHCYEAGDMLVMLGISKEFGYKISAFHHAVEAYKIADILAKEGICADMWADSWGFKLEAYDGIPENAALVHKAGGCAVIHSDSAENIQRLNQEAAKAMAAGNRMGMSLTPEVVIQWITLNPAKSLGIDRMTGSLEEGKMADVVLWSSNPFSVYAKADKVWIDGALAFDRADPAHRPVTDYELGLRGEGRK
jgi:imidazolonepropionase-like amidohydrolase